MPPSLTDLYKDLYAKAKKAGEPFYPFIVYKDAIAALVVFLAILTLAIVKGAELEARADPASASYNPRPEWYFLFLFEFLKFFPGSMEAVAAIIIPTLFILLLFLLPFIDSHPLRRHPLDRPVVVSIGGVILAGIVGLTIMGARSPLVNPPSAEKPLVAQGHHLIHELQCTLCHSLNGRGGSVGPDLAAAPHAQDTEWLKQHFENPQNQVKSSVMPELNLLPSETEAIIAYIQDTTSATQFSAAAPKLFQDECMSCHKIGGLGSDKGPDLSSIGTVRDKNWLFQAISAPESVGLDGEEMPSFQEDFMESQLEDLARYLAAQDGNGGSPGQKMEQALSSGGLVEVTYTQDAPFLYQRYCGGCHMIDGVGGTDGPDLSAVGAYRDAEFLAQVIRNPSEVIKGAEMPGFADKLDPETIQDLAIFLTAQTSSDVVAQAQPTPTPGPVSFAADIAPIFDDTCISCHGVYATYVDLDLRSYEGLMKTGQTKPIIIPGDSEHSLLYLTLVDKAGDVDRMPMSGLLSTRHIQMIQHWIDQGAQNN
ncbi:MAG: c-type cytochrome [Anaerolineae bacterium]